MAPGRPRSLKQAFEGCENGVFANRFSASHEQKARGVICDGERVTVAVVAQAEFAFEIDAPQIVWRGPADSGVPWRGPAFVARV